jgi:bifunctional non-homologous end joining protein LigD
LSRQMSDILKVLGKEERNRLKKKSEPKWTAPMLATLTDRRFSDEKWIYERKLDGERCLAFRKGRKIIVFSRNRKQLNDTYPELVDSFLKQGAEDFIADGEIVTFEGGRTSFSRLQHRLQIKDVDEAGKSKIAIYYYLFDLLYLDGYETAKLGLRKRKKLLKRIFTYKKPLRFTAHRNKEGESYYQNACRKGWEGIVAKRADSQYVHSRSKDWLKFKCSKQQEFVIGGYTDPKGGRVGLGALLIGYYEDKDLSFAGKVGTGFDDETLRSMREKLSSLERKSCPLLAEIYTVKVFIG